VLLLTLSLGRLGRFRTGHPRPTRNAPPQVIDHIAGLCRKHGRRMMVRLVKGAYWDPEIKRRQERGLEGYAAYTRKAATDLSLSRLFATAARSA